MLAGTGAEEFALEQGLEPVPNRYFVTERRRSASSSAWLHGGQAGRHGIFMGTVGAVALDASGNLAAATSTGGMTGKRWGRVGDSPIIGAGTYAANDACAVSATGHGEYFIRRDRGARNRVAGALRGTRRALQAAETVVHGNSRRWAASAE